MLDIQVSTPRRHFRNSFNYHIKAGPQVHIASYALPQCVEQSVKVAITHFHLAQRISIYESLKSMPPMSSHYDRQQGNFLYIFTSYKPQQVKWGLICTPNLCHTIHQILVISIFSHWRSQWIENARGTPCELQFYTTYSLSALFQ